MTTDQTKSTESDATLQQAQGETKLVTREGVVTSDRMNKTIGVQSTRHVRHRKYGKYVRRVSNYKVHDEKEEARNGDTVEIAQCRPLSRTKAWRLLRVVKRKK